LPRCSPSSGSDTRGLEARAVTSRSFKRNGWRIASPAPLFLDELAGAERQLRAKPDNGTVYATHKSGAVRRIFLAGTSHLRESLA
jgi:hypothetical protein